MAGECREGFDVVVGRVLKPAGRHSDGQIRVGLATGVSVARVWSHIEGRRDDHEHPRAR